MRRGVFIAALLFLQAACLWGQPVYRISMADTPAQKGIIPSIGEVHIPVILLEFADVSRTLEEPLEHFQRISSRNSL